MGEISGRLSRGPNLARPADDIRASFGADRRKVWSLHSVIAKYMAVSPHGNVSPLDEAGGLEEGP